MPASKPASNGDAIDAALESAVQGGLVYVSDADPGFRRRRSGNGFVYLDSSGKSIRDTHTLARIRALAIPPAYRDVWICTRANGHLQATGRDARGRKQYRYHARWREVRDAEKFDRIVAFGSSLPRLRRRLRRDLAMSGLPRDKVLAVVVAIMADTMVRIGNEEYARGNKAFGLTTLRNRHVEFLRGGRARLRFRGKGGLEHDVVLDDTRLARLVRSCQQLPGQQLFQYEDDDGHVQPIDSGMVNDYLRDAMGADFTAKDFRTWGGTLAAMRLLAREADPGDADPQPSQRSIAATRNAVIAEVAKQLRNTPAVCRKSYIDPVVLDAWGAGRLHAFTKDARGQRQWEQALLRFLRRERRGLAGKTR
ncbi:DNA topoisomerase IB [Lysobacter sp. Root494]|uniref:DNA topoisomerase IB n=1 Tax=Lysobacter sp. Root494 TaxID=1736549 RepID=UPI0006F8B41B|nr:DNA topoisomerase IB [Lysobacter sp. Root494]KQY49712.1 DNA topoisomerase [Lysobacter sp. Root494]